MSNVFDNIPTTLPTKLTVGDSWEWQEVDLSTVYPTAQYTLKYQGTNLDANTSWTIICNKVDDVHTAQVDSVTTGTYDTGNADVALQVTRDSDGRTVTLNYFYIELLSNTPEQSYNYKVLLAIRATLAKTATKEQMQYSISGMQLIRRSPAELLKLESEFAKRVAAEQKARARASGKIVPNGVTKIVMGA